MPLKSGPNRKFQPLTISKFKGMNAGLLGSVPEEYNQDDEELVDIINFQLTTDGYLEKRLGATSRSTVTTPTTPTSLRILGMQRTRVTGEVNRYFATDNVNTWRIDGLNGNDTVLTVGGASMTGVQATVEYGGESESQSYNCFALRWLPNPAPNPSAAGGVVMLFGDNSTNSSNWLPNTPMGTQIMVFKNRAFVINSLGAYYSVINFAGDETKVWFSQPGHFEDFGGVGLTNNFNLDFGDGDFLTAIQPFNDQLVMFKTRKTFTVTADGDPADWTQRLVSDRIGCVGRGTVKVINGIIYFLSADGVMRTDGTTFQNISAPVQDYLDIYRDYVNPQLVLDLYASYWDQKYILWLRELGTCTKALVYDLKTEGWCRWELGSGVTVLGETTWDEHYPPTLFLGSATANKIWGMGNLVYQDNGLNFNSSFVTKKYDLGRAMARKRNHLVGITVKDSSSSVGTYRIETTADDNTVVSSLQAPASFEVRNLKAKGAGYGRYFQTAVTQNSFAYTAVYDFTMMNEERGFIQRSSPTPPIVALDPAKIFNLGPDAQDKLDNGMKMG